MKTRALYQVFALLTLAGAGALPSLLACGGNKPADNAANPSATTPPTDTASASASVADGTPSASASAAPADSGPPPVTNVTQTAVQQMMDAAKAAPAATMKADGIKGNDGLAKSLRDLAKKAAPGMQPDGPLALGNVKEKSRIATDVTFQPGKCYTLVGYSVKVKDLDLHLLLPPGILSGEDTTDDNKPTIGGAPSPVCPTSTVPITYKLDIFADSGSGDVAVQLFSKPSQ
jgi:hypothetical protein